MKRSAAAAAAISAPAAPSASDPGPAAPATTDEGFPSGTGGNRTRSAHRQRGDDDVVPVVAGLLVERTAAGHEHEAGRARAGEDVDRERALRVAANRRDAVLERRARGRGQAHDLAAA